MSASIIAGPNWRRQTKVFERQHSHTLSVWQQYGRRLTPISVHGAPFRRVCLDCAMEGKVWPERLKVRRSGRQPANGGVYARPENSAAQPTISIENRSKLLAESAFQAVDVVILIRKYRFSIVEIHEALRRPAPRSAALQQC
jgi:DMSO/TMAO reductase YedYZ molybdopterin-dependent catalytic subunit